MADHYRHKNAQTLSDTDWTLEEQWVWKQIREDKVANFNDRYRKEADPNTRSDICTSPPRSLRSSFLFEILTNPKFNSEIPPSGARIVGAYFDADVDLSCIHFKLPLQLEGSRFEGKLLLQRATFDGLLSFRSSAFYNAVSLAEIKVGHSLDASGSTFNYNNQLSIDLRSAKIGRTVYLNGVRCIPKLDMFGIEVDLDIFIEEFQTERSCLFSTFESEVYLLSAKINGSIQAHYAHFKKLVDMGGIKIGKSLFLRKNSIFDGEVKIIEASIGDSMDASRSRFVKILNMDHTSLKHSLHLILSKLDDGFTIIGGKVGSKLDMSGASFGARADLTGAKIDGELRLGRRQPEKKPHGPAQWHGPYAQLIVRDAKAGTLQDGDLPDAWPQGRDMLVLDGLTYDRLGESMMTRETSWYEKWLDRNRGTKDQPSSPQPYQQLAKIFREAGADDKANDILYAARERARDEAKHQHGWWPGWRWIGLWLLNSTIGYGIGLGYFRILLWVFILTAFGLLVLCFFNQAPSLEALPAPASYPAGVYQRGHAVLARTLYSLDHLLPIVQLDKSFDDIKLQEFPKYYFYVHKLVGWAIGSFLLAALAGLTQRR